MFIYSVAITQRRVSVFDTLRFFRSFAAKNQRALGREAPFYPPPVRTIRPATVRSTRSTLLSSEYALRHTATTVNMIPICSIQMENILTERKDPTVNTIRRRIV